MSPDGIVGTETLGSPANSRDSRATTTAQPARPAGSGATAQRFRSTSLPISRRRRLGRRSAAWACWPAI